MGCDEPAVDDVIGGGLVAAPRAGGVDVGHWSGHGPGEGSTSLQRPAAPPAIESVVTSIERGRSERGRIAL
jgi:hypothetical protein